MLSFSGLKFCSCNKISELFVTRQEAVWQEHELDGYVAIFSQLNHTQTDILSNQILLSDQICGLSLYLLIFKPMFDLMKSDLCITWAAHTLV